MRQSYYKKQLCLVVRGILRNFTQIFGVVRIKNPYKKAQEQLIEVYPVSYQMNFDANVIEKRYAD